MPMDRSKLPLSSGLIPRNLLRGIRPEIAGQTTPRSKLRGGLLRSLAAVVGTMTMGILLAGAVSPAFAVKRAPHRFRGLGCLPLSGDLGPAGLAFRDGFAKGLAESRDTSFRWDWRWTDNRSDPLATQAWTDTAGRHLRQDLLLAGMGPAVDGFRPRPDSAPCLFLGDGPDPAPGLVWHLWPTTHRMRATLLERLRQAPSPVAIVVTASGSWAEIVIDGLRDSLPGALVLPHDLDNQHWDKYVQQLLETNPKTILFWNRPHEASALLAKRLVWPVLRKADLLVPEGTVLPDSVEASIAAPVWQPSSPPDSLQCARYAAWGRLVGRSVAQASKIVLRDSLRGFQPALERVQADPSAMETAANGWFPKIQIDSGHRSLPVVR